MKSHRTIIHLLLLLAVMLSNVHLAAQDSVAVDTLGRIEGTISDEEEIPMQGVTLRVMNAKDSVFCTAAITDSLGHYKIGELRRGGYIMSYSLLGFQKGYVNFNITAKRPEILVPNLQMQTMDVVLNAAVVTASIPPVTVIDDTVAYNADAYHVQEGAMVEDLIERIPGAEITDDGQIKINGKVYNKILIDGKEFFGNDPQATLKNLPANIVKRLKTYDRKSERARLTGIDDGEENNVIDIEIKPNMFKGIIGQINGAMGNHDRYSSSLNVNKFRKDRHLSVMGGVNNVNNPGFSEKGNGAVNFSKAGRPGLTASKGIGVTYAQDKKDKYRISGNVRYNGSNAETQSSQHSETVYNDSNYRFNDSEKHSVRRRDELNMNLNLEWKPDTLTTIKLQPDFTYSKTDSWSTDESGSQRWNGRDAEDSVRINQRKASNNTNQEGSDESVSFGVMRRLSRSGRNVSFQSSYNYKSYSGSNITRNQTTYFLQPKKNRNYSRFADNDNYSKGYNVGLSYNEPIYKGGFLQFSYRFSYRHARSNRYGYQLDYNSSDSLFADGDDLDWRSLPVDTALSSCHENTYLTHAINLNMRHVSPKVNFSYGVNLNPRHNETNYILGPKMYKGLITQNLMNWAPNMMFKYRFTKRTSVDFSYHGNSDEPNMDDLQEVIDKTNPQNVKYGNPLLKPSFTNNLRMNFNYYGVNSHRSLVTNFNYTSKNNATSNMTLTESSTGVRVSKLMNVDGGWNMSGNINFNTPIDSLEHLTLSTESSIDMAEHTNFNSTPLTDKELRDAGVTVDFQDIEPDDIDKLQPLALKNHTHTLRLSQQLSLRYRWNDCLFRLSGGVNYYKVDNSIRKANQRETFDYNLRANVQLDLPFELQVSTTMNFTSRQGYSSNIQRNIAMWNAEISKRFLKRNAGLLSFQIFDILHQRSSISSAINNLTVTDTRSQALRNYFLVAFQYRLNTMARGKKYGGGDKQNKRTDKKSSSKGKRKGAGK